MLNKRFNKVLCAAAGNIQALCRNMFGNSLSTPPLDVTANKLFSLLIILMSSPLCVISVGLNCRVRETTYLSKSLMASGGSSIQIHVTPFYLLTFKVNILFVNTFFLDIKQSLC